MSRVKSQACTPRYEVHHEDNLDELRKVEPEVKRGEINLHLDYSPSGAP